MKRDYAVYPSMIDSEPGIVWFYNNTQKISPLNETSPLGVSADRCNDSSFCLGIYHHYGNLMIHLKRNMLYSVNGINGQLLADKDFYQ